MTSKFLTATPKKYAKITICPQFEIDWSDLESDIGFALLRWIYTDVIDLQHDTLALGLLRAAHRFQLPGLLGLCERALVSSVGVRSCVRFYCVAEEVGAASLLEYCSGLISTHWDDLTTQDFEHMTSPLLYKMLKAKSEWNAVFCCCCCCEYCEISLFGNFMRFIFLKFFIANLINIFLWIIFFKVIIRYMLQFD